MRIIKILKDRRVSVAVSDTYLLLNETVKEDADGLGTGGCLNTSNRGIGLCSVIYWLI
ncbi:MAG TPA: hypothetical protein VFU48_04230 [Nitrospira sp.]|nr:hypothetical protein [Nitrospira sp.]